MYEEATWKEGITRKHKGWRNSLLQYNKMVNKIVRLGNRERIFAVKVMMKRQIGSWIVDETNFLEFIPVVKGDKRHDFK